MSVRVSLTNSQRSFSVEDGQPVLEAALRAGLNFPHGCRGGNCGACRAKLVEGTVHYPNGPPLGLAAAEVADGDILLCQARCSSDIEIDALEVHTPDAGVVKRLPCRVERAKLLCHDVLALWLRLPAAESFEFQAGQYVDIILQDGRRRSFSMASPPHDSRFLQLHVRRVPGGEFTERLFAECRPGMLLRIEGPLGRFVLDAARRPLLLIGGGTGLAPLQSIVRHVVETKVERQMVLYWGVRAQRDLYAHDELIELANRARGFQYFPVLSEPGAGWHGLRGWVHEAALNAVAGLAGFDVYSSGPPALIESVRREFPAHGADPGRLFFDSFDYASDTLERQRTIALTKD